MSTDWKAVLEKIAPTAATLLGGPFAGLAVGAVESALGVGNQDSTVPTSGIPSTTADRVSTIQKILSTGQLSGDQIVALKSAEIQLQQHLADNNIQLEQLAVTDTVSARQRETDLAKSGAKDNTNKVLAYALTIGFFADLILLSYHEIPPASHDVLLIMIGSLGTAWAGMVHYYYGSSPSSKTKDDTIAAATAALNS
jgi:hypothetical protein